MDYATGWWGVNETPDYFNVCDTFYPPLSFGVPHNLAGLQLPYEGNAYVGLVTRTFFPNYREVIGCALLDTLYAGSTYLLSMRVNRGGGIGMAVCSNNIGMRFSNTAYTSGNPIPIDNFAYVKVDSLVIDSTNWIHLQWTFIPDSSYTYLYIGNFFDDALTDTLHLGTVYPNTAYYYIDNVCVSSNNSNCDFTSVSHQPVSAVSVYPNPASGVLYVQSPGKSGYAIVDVLGRKAMEGFFENSAQIDVAPLPAGIYIVSVTLGNKTVRQKQLLTIR